MIGALLLTTELRIEMSAPPWAWAAWLFAFAVLAGLAAMRIRRLILAYVLEIEPYDAKLRGVHGDVFGSVVDGSLEILPGDHTYLVDKAWTRAVVPALLVVAPARGVGRFTSDIDAAVRGDAISTSSLIRRFATRKIVRGSFRRFSRQ